jgi:hypothetical protein
VIVAIKIDSLKLAKRFGNGGDGDVTIEDSNHPLVVDYGMIDLLPAVG